jgi:hypothetical protein
MIAYIMLNPLINSKGRNHRGIILFTPEVRPFLLVLLIELNLLGISGFLPLIISSPSKKSTSNCSINRSLLNGLYNLYRGNLTTCLVQNRKIARVSNKTKSISFLMKFQRQFNFIRIRNFYFRF